MKKPAPTKPDPKCKQCGPYGCWPDWARMGEWIPITQERDKKNGIACPECHKSK